MRILFCNIANMKYYKGIFPGIDEPRFGGAYVLQTGDGGEKYNFFPTQIQGDEVCLGFVETKRTNGVRINQLHIEKIEGISLDAQEAEGVLAVWCALHNNDKTAVMGWYRNATVYRWRESISFELDTGEVEEAVFNIKADASDCVLLPYGERNAHTWWVPRERQTRSYGFGQANVWFAQEEKAEAYVKKLVERIESYRGENWLRIFPEEM